MSILIFANDYMMSAVVHIGIGGSEERDDNHKPHSK